MESCKQTCIHTYVTCSAYLEVRDRITCLAKLNTDWRRTQTADPPQRPSNQTRWSRGFVWEKSTVLLRQVGTRTVGRLFSNNALSLLVGWRELGIRPIVKKISHQQSSSKILWKIFGGGIWSTWSNGRKNKPTVVLSCYLHQRRLRFHRRYFVRLHDDAKATQLAFARFGENLTHGPRKKRYLVIRITFR